MRRNGKRAGSEDVPALMRRRCTDWNARRRPRRLDASLTEQQENLGEVCDLSCLGEVVVGHALQLQLEGAGGKTRSP